MASRGHLPPGYGSRQVQAPGMMRHGSFPAGNRLVEPFPDNLEAKLAVQEAEIERLASDNRQLAVTDGALRRDLAAAEQDVERLRAHIGSIKTESDIQIRVLMDKIGRMEGEIRGGEILRKELQMAHVEVKGLVADRQELSVKIEEASNDLDRALDDIKKVPEMIGELDGLRKEHQRLRTTFEHKKSLNMEKVEEMKVLDKDLLAMSREIDRLRSEVLNAENSARAPPNTYGDYVNSDPLYPPPAPPHGGAGVTADGDYAWGGSYDNSDTRR